jgi:transposase
MESRFRAYQARNRIARLFNNLKQLRHIATRHDETERSFTAPLLCPPFASAAIIHRDIPKPTT